MDRCAWRLHHPQYCVRRGYQQPSRLAWRNSSSLTKGNKADKVLGQRDFISNLIQGPGHDLSSGLPYPLEWPSIPPETFM
jgi:hypothetical protein